MAHHELVGVQRTLTPVLRAKALDNRLPEPVLGDRDAERTMRALDPDYDRRWFGTSQAGIGAVIRAKTHDDWARDFLADHPDAVVLHLGCGLDARVFRVDPPGTVDWYDLDYPDVITLRREHLPDRPHTTMIGTSVTDPGWLDRIPRDRPVLMIAEGLVPYLTVAEVRRLLTDLIEAFPLGQFQFETCPVWVQRSSGWDPTLRKYGTRFNFSCNDPAALADWHPRLRYLGEAPMNDSPLIARAPANIRLLYAIMNRLGMRHTMRIVRYGFAG
ncbi:class I SAM-dependent methyltransferase [Microlunatus sp. GCM10028923]|uniref:class I SAM-dependent methyltransferase n=1 Tax=Microlunatus sp. GCM10028923 TaxID=3273400 RepID=UPI00360E44EC